MKKFLLILCLVLTGCHQIPQKKVHYAFHKTVLCDNSRLKMVMDDGFMSKENYILSLKITNKVKQPMRLYLSDVSINGAMVSLDYDRFIAKDTKDLEIRFRDLTRYQIKAVRQIRLLCDVEAGGVTCFNKALTLYPLKTHKMKRSVIDAPHQKMKLLDSFQVSLFAYRFKQSTKKAILYLALANKTDNALTFSLKTTMLKNLHVQGGWSQTLNGHTIMYTSMPITKVHQKALKAIKLPILVYDYKNTSVVNHNFIINLEKLK